MKWTTLLYAMVIFISTPVQAVVSLTGTRLVFDGQFREATIDVANHDHTQALIQAWLSPVHADSKAEPLPFVVTPHLLQLPAQGRHTLRILYEGIGMPQDRESLLHLYVLQVPKRREGPQQLNIAVRQRINVFYRPTGLPGDPADAVQALQWQRSPLDRTVMNVRNPTPFHVSLHNLVINGQPLLDDLLIEPFSQRQLSLPAGVEARSGLLNFSALTDYGGSRPFCAQVRDDAPFKARPGASGTQPSIGKC
jgi:P pilus assembly chaperone PapD